MEYNKSKNTVDKVGGIFGIVSASLYIILSLVFIIVAINYFAGNFDEVYSVPRYDYFGNFMYYEYYYDDYSSVGNPFMIFGVFFLALAVLMMIYSIKLVKSPFLPNGELKNKKAIRIWMLVLSILSGELVVIGLMIAALCMKDYKEPVIQTSNGFIPQYNKPVNTVNTVQVSDQQKFYDFYNKIQEIKKLRSLEIIDDVAVSKALTKIVKDMLKD